MSNKPSAGLPAWLALLVAPFFLLAALLFYRNVHSQLPPAEQETLLAPVGRLVVKDAAPAADNKAEAPPATAKKEAAKTEEKPATAPKAEKVEAKEKPAAEAKAEVQEGSASADAAKKADAAKADDSKSEEKPDAAKKADEPKAEAKEEAKEEEKPAAEAKAEEKKAETKAEAQEGSASASEAKKAEAKEEAKAEEQKADAKKADEAKAETQEEAKEEAKAEETKAATGSASASEAQAAEPKTDAKGDEAKGDAGCEATLLVGDDMSYNLAEITLDKAACPEFTVHLKHQGQMSASVMGHNVVISAAADKDAIAGAGADAGLEQNFVPASDPRVLAHTKILGGGEADSVRFSTDKFKAGGDYDFYCTYPGHASMMHGKVIVK